MMSGFDRLLGTWDFTMQHADVSEPVTGRHRYELVLDGAFVQLHWSYHHPDFPDATALFSQERYHYFDVRGVTRVFDVQLEEGGWSLVNVDPVFSQRGTSRFRGPDAFDTTGERSYDAGVTWHPDFTMRSGRVLA